MNGSMTKLAALISVFALFASLPRLRGQDDSWTKELKDRTQRGTLHNAREFVRGDSGKWNDAPRLQHAPPLQSKPANVSLDDWADQLLEKDFRLDGNADNWLIFRTQQLNDNDRVGIERIERDGNQFTVVVSQAVWQGRYRKNFTYYDVLGVNLGKLEPGEYQAKCIVTPLAFSTFEGTGQPRENWPKDERPTDHKPTELSVTFSVVDGDQ